MVTAEVKEMTFRFPVDRLQTTAEVVSTARQECYF